ncbi:MAG TPA: serine hydrolase, partial [Gaiellaceae bacterium]|nr:serine hydrolase [Gaiellaceae bacterium]
MKRVVLLLVLAALVCASAARATPVPPIDAKAYLVIDARTGQVLASSHADEERPIASLTKLMTVLLTLEHHKLTDVVTVDKRAASVGESSIALDPGQKITVRDLLEGALIQSANDAADALALSMAKDYPAFAKLMNAKAQELGLAHTHFVRPDGLDAPGEYSTAADITKLAQIAMRNSFVRASVQKETATISD